MIALQTEPERRRVLAAAAFLLIAVACNQEDHEPGADEHGHGSAMNDEAEGPNGGRLLRSENFELELAIFEAGAPPEYRAWATLDGKAVEPKNLDLEVILTRLGGTTDRIEFVPQGDHNVGKQTVAEPHSFEVAVEANHEGKRYVWAFESFEGRTQIAQEMAQSLGVKTEIAGQASLEQVVTLYGRVRTNPERVRELRARFEGTLHEVNATVGSRVRKGDALMSIESNESLNRYTVTAPIAGIVTQRDANAGELTQDRLLMTVTDTSSVWVDLSVFPVDRDGIGVGSSVSIVPALGGDPVGGKIFLVETAADPHDQSVVARVALKDAGTRLLPGTFVTGEVTVGEQVVPVAVKRTALQKFREWQVVYAVVDDVYEVRMLDLGRTTKAWAEVLGGLEPGTRYVTSNSHLIKADIEKSGASHDH